MKTLTDSDIVKTARFNQIEPAVLKSIAITEANGSGFMQDGRCKILFEGHLFWAELLKKGIDPSQFVKANEDILYPTWKKDFYNQDQWLRLEKAKKIHAESALKSTSWGMFQILGSNYKECGYCDVFEFTASMQQNEFNQLRALVSFLYAAKLINFLKKIRTDGTAWSQFARGYNGPRYKENNYDIKLLKNYQLNIDLNSQQ